MFTRPIDRIIFVDIDLGSGCPTSGGPSKLTSTRPKDTITELSEEFKQQLGVETYYLRPSDAVERLELPALIKPGVMVISTDNVVSWDILRAFWCTPPSNGNRNDIDANLVFDQHIDIYSYKTHGRELSKANVYRFALNMGVVRRMVFAGSRFLEEAFFNPFILLGGSNTLDFPYAWFRNKQSQHADLDDFINKFPARESKSLLEALCFSLIILASHNRALLWKKQEPLRNIGLEIDLDVFDSNEIQGVDYGPHLPSRLTKDAYQRLAEAAGTQKPRALLKLFYDLWVISYIKHKIQCPGFRVPTDEDIRDCAILIRKSKLNFPFIHITEYKPEFDDPTRKTTTLLKKIVAAFVEESRRVATR